MKSDDFLQDVAVFNLVKKKVEWVGCHLIGRL